MKLIDQIVAVAECGFEVRFRIHHVTKKDLLTVEVIRDQDNGQRYTAARAFLIPDDLGDGNLSGNICDMAAAIRRC